MGGRDSAFLLTWRGRTNGTVARPAEQPTNQAKQQIRFSTDLLDLVRPELFRSFSVTGCFKLGIMLGSVIASGLANRKAWQVVVLRGSWTLANILSRWCFEASTEMCLSLLFDGRATPAKLSGSCGREWNTRDVPRKKNNTSICSRRPSLDSNRLTKKREKGQLPLGFKMNLLLQPTHTSAARLACSSVPAFELLQSVCWCCCPPRPSLRCKSRDHPEPD